MSEIEKKLSVKDIIYNGLFRQNAVLVSGLVTAPVIVYVTDFRCAVTLITAFSMVSFYTLTVSSFVSQKIAYTIRIILYTLIGAVIYIPSRIILYSLIPAQMEEMGVFFPLLIINSLIISRSETTYFLETKSRMLLDIFFSIAGYDIAVLIFGAAREIISIGELNGHIFAVPIIFQGFSSPFGGFILLGIFAAAVRGISLIIRKTNT